jgi:hypothetical protein
MAMKKFIILFILVFLLIGGVFIYWKYYYTYSEGNRAGLLQKFSYRGNIFKTYEGEMVLSSIESSKDVPLASEKFLFSVTDPRVAAMLNTLEGHFIVVHYLQKHGKVWWLGDTEYFVDSVREAR